MSAEDLLERSDVQAVPVHMSATVISHRTSAGTCSQ